MKILITGSTGLLGQALSRHFAPTADVTGLSRHAPTAEPPGRHAVCDLQDARRTMKQITEARPDVVIHTQALSDVDRCEREPELARAMNVSTTAHVVEAARVAGARLVYVSTDYVFEGTKGGPYDEADAPHPISVYGSSKLEGERLALAYAGGFVVRPSTLFGSGRMNFCDHIVARVRAGEPVEAFRDQRTSPTYTEDLAEGIGDLVRVIRRQPAGGVLPSRTLHVANIGGCSRLEFAHHVVDLLGGSRQLVRAIEMAAQQRPAPRPRDSTMASRFFTQLIGRTLRSWDGALEAYLRERQWLN